MKKFLATLFAVMMVLSVAACSSMADEAAPAGLSKSYSFNIGSSSTAGTTITKTFEAVQESVGADSDGKLKLTYFGASSLGTDKEMLTECMAGNIPIVVMTTASMTSSVPELAVFDMHCAASSMEVYTKLFEDEEFLAKVQSWFAAQGLKLIAWETQSDKLLASTDPIHTIEDFNGYNMRTLSNKYHIAFWSAVGANTIQIDASELYLSVQQGLIQGIEMNMASILSRKLPEVCGYVIETVDLPHISMAVMSLDVYESMTPEDQAWFDNYMATVNQKFNETAVGDNTEGWETLAAAGVEAIRYNEELFAQMREIAQNSSWVEVRAKLGDETVDFYLSRIAEIEAAA